MPLSDPQRKSLEKLFRSLTMMAMSGVLGVIDGITVIEGLVFPVDRWLIAIQERR